MYGKYSTRVCVERLIQHKAKQVLYLPQDTLRVLYFCTHKQGGALSVILYFLVVCLEAISSSTQTAVIFGDQDISKCSYDLLHF